jgi:hypothetical protein
MMPEKSPIGAAFGADKPSETKKYRFFEKNT